MTQLRVLISGAGIAGTSLAFWLSKLGHHVTVIEHYSKLRATGLQIDVRGHGVEVLRKMGLEQKFHAYSVKEEGLRFVNSQGRQIAYFPANRTGQGVQNFTTDHEIMRGDLCRLLYDACEGRVNYTFNTSIQSINEDASGLEILFSDGHRDHFDLVVGADGQRSRTRQLMLRPEDPEPFHPLGMFGGYFTVPRKMEENESYNATAYLSTNNRFILTRRHSPESLQVYLFCKHDPARMHYRRSSRGQAQKDTLSSTFKGAGWESSRIIEDLNVSDNFYGDEAGFITMKYWSRGPVALIGDAAYGSSGMTGMGTTSAIVGAYILAGEISEVFSNSVDGDVQQKLTAALNSYETKFRPFIDQVNSHLSANSPTLDWVLSKSITITICQLLLFIVSLFQLDIIAKWFLREDIKNWKLPQYPALPVP